MGTALLSTLYPLMADLPGCPDPVKLQALQEAARRFTEETHIWREQMDDITAVADTADYTLAGAYTGCRIIAITRVDLDEATLDPADYSLSPTRVLTLDPAPVAAGTIEVWAVYAGGAAPTAVVDWLLADWGHGIVAAARASLRATPGSARDPVPWYDPQGAARDEEMYRKDMIRARESKLTGRLNGNIFIAPGEFG